MDDYSCNHFKEIFKIEKGLKIHIGRIHKESTPEKECVAVEEELSLNIAPIKEVRDEPPDEEQSGSQQLYLPFVYFCIKFTYFKGVSCSEGATNTQVDK